jgi:hypothetical protein
MTLIRPDVTYAYGSWKLTVRDIINSLVFDRQILGKLFGPIQYEGRWRIRSNNELQKLIKGEDVIKYVKTQKIKLCGHLNRMKI